MPEKIGFVGVGRMGANMARRLQESGYPVAAVFDVNNAAAQALAQELSCVAAENLKTVTALADVIVTVVSDDLAMKRIYVGGLLNHASSVVSIQFDRIGRHVVTASMDGTAQVWEIATGARVGKPMKHAATVTYAEFSPDGTSTRHRGSA